MLAKAKEILEGNGYSSGKLEDSEVGDNTSKLYKASLNKYTSMPILDTSLKHSSSQLALLRKQRALHERMARYNKRTLFSPDSDKVMMGTDLPNFKNEVSVSRNSAYAEMNPFNPVAKNGRRL